MIANTDAKPGIALARTGLMTKYTADRHGLTLARSLCIARSESVLEWHIAAALVARQKRWSIPGPAL